MRENLYEEMASTSASSGAIGSLEREMGKNMSSGKSELELALPLALIHPNIRYASHECPRSDNLPPPLLSSRAFVGENTDHPHEFVTVCTPVMLNAEDRSRTAQRLYQQKLLQQLCRSDSGVSDPSSYRNCLSPVMSHGCLSPAMYRSSLSPAPSSAIGYNSRPSNPDRLEFDAEHIIVKRGNRWPCEFHDHLNFMIV